MIDAARFRWLLLLLLLPSCARFQETETDFGVPEEAYVRTERGRTFVLDRGEGPTILLIHGYGSSHRAWLPVVDDLVDRGYRVLAVDLPGFGYSDRNPGDYSPEGLASHLLEILDAKGAERVDVMAHSWGGSIALRLALEHPERVGRLVLASAWVYEEQLPPFITWSRARGIGEALYTLFYRERVSDRYELSWYAPDEMVRQESVDGVERDLARPGTTAAALAAARSQRFAEVQERYGEVSAESLLIWGQQDVVSTPDVGTRLARQLPRARLVLLDRCGHIPMVERAGQFVHEVLRFLGPAPTTSLEDRPEPPAPTPVQRPPQSDEEGAAVEPREEASRPWGPPPETIEEEPEPLDEEALPQ